MESLEFHTLEISTDSTLLHEQNNITPYIASILEKLYNDALKGKKIVIEKLLKNIKKYPNVPIFKNYLSTAYEAMGKENKAFEVNRAIKEHPDYLYAKINLAKEYIKSEDYEKVLGVLGEHLQLQNLYPNRSKFHLNEVFSYYIIVIEYLYAIDKEEQAEIIISFLKELDPENSKLEYIETQRTGFIFKKVVARHEEEDKLTRLVQTKDRRGNIQTDKTPDFNFPEMMKNFYQLDMDVSNSFIEKVLTMDSEKIGKDLIVMLTDAIKRYDFFSEKYDLDWDSLLLSFPSHALFFISEIKPPGALEVVLEMLRQDREFNEFWFGDAMDDLFIPTLYSLIKEQPQIIFNFLKEPHIECYSRNIAIASVNLITKREPQRKNELIEYHKELLLFLTEYNEDPSIGDTDFLGLYICDLIDINAEELLPQIKMLFDKNAVGYWICGDYKEVEKHIHEKSHHERKFGENIYELYKNFADSWIEEEILDTPSGIDSNIIKGYFTPNLPYIKEKKTGRNDPCPCGSGKKYKKCCLN